MTRIPDRFTGPDAVWSLIAEARARLPHAWEALGRMGGMDGRDVAQAIIVALACRERGSGICTRISPRWSHRSHGWPRRSPGSGTASRPAKDIYFDYADPQHLDLKLRDATAAVTVSDHNVEYLRRRFGRDAAGTLRIYNGLDLERFAYLPRRREATDILAVGRLVEKKGFHILVEAIRLLRASGREVSCRIVGQGEEAGDLASQIETSGLAGAMHLLGPRSQGEVLGEMRGAAALACPCVVGGDGNRDGMQTVLLEAMALGLPCVATDVTGIPELVRDGETGLLVPEGDPEALAGALAQMLDDADLRGRLSRAGRARIELTAVRGNLFRYLQSLSLGFHARARAGDLTMRLIGDVGMLKETAVTAALPLLANCLVFVGMIGVMLWLDWRPALVALSPLPLLWHTSMRLTRRIRNVSRKQRKRQGELAATSAETMAGIRSAQALGLEDHVSAEFEGANAADLREGVGASASPPGSNAPSTC